MAIDSLGNDNLLFTLKTCPWGACDDAALLFARYLQANGFPPPAFPVRCVPTRTAVSNKTRMRKRILKIDKIPPRAFVRGLSGPLIAK